MTRARRLSIVLVLGLGAPLLRGAPAGAGSEFTFFGSGYGTGLGMSQYGALGLARQGWSASRIVRHYYAGVLVDRRDPPADQIRVGVLQDRSGVVLIAVEGSFDLVLKNGTTIDTVTEGGRREVRITADERYQVVKPSTGELIGGRSWGSRANDLVARRASGGRIRVPDWGHEVGRGDLEFDIAAPRSAHLVAVVTVEQYVNGVSEMPRAWPLEALGAQAIASRTYAYWRLAGAGPSGCSCDIRSTTVDQVWIGWDSEAGPGGSRWVQAIRDTRRLVITYHGAFIYAAYGSSSGGYTESLRRVWPGGADLPYLQGVCDPRDDVADNPNVTWAVSFSPGTVTGALRPYTGDIGTVQRFTSYRRGVSGRVTTVKVVGTGGAARVEGWDVRSALGLKDTRFSVNRDLNITGKIRAEYDRIGCTPGRSATPDNDVDGGRWQGFRRGRMYYNAGRNRVTWVRGAVLREYLNRRAHRGPLGLPVRYESIDGGTRGTFDGGTITCRSGCTVSYG